jgi:hypothetical protein
MHGQCLQHGIHTMWSHDFLWDMRTPYSEVCYLSEVDWRSRESVYVLNRKWRKNRVYIFQTLWMKGMRWKQDAYALVFDTRVRLSGLHGVSRVYQRILSLIRQHYLLHFWAFQLFGRMVSVRVEVWNKICILKNLKCMWCI